MLGVVTKGEI